MDRHFITCDTGDIAPGEVDPPIACAEPARPDHVTELLAATTEGEDGRSEWVWVRLRDGTLMLATFPQGETYLRFTDEPEAAHW